MAMAKPRRLKGHKGTVTCCIASRDRPGIIATSGEDGCICWFDMRCKDVLFTMDLEKKPISSICFKPGNEDVVYASSGTEVIEQEERKAMTEAVKEVAHSLVLEVSLRSFACPWKALLHTGVMTFYCCMEHEFMLPTQVDAVFTDDYNYETFSLLVETYDYRSWLLKTEAHRFSSREAKCLVKRMEVSPRSLQNMFYNRLYQDSAAQKEYLMDRLRYILDPPRERIRHWEILRADPTRESLTKLYYTPEDLRQVVAKRDRWFDRKFEGLEIDDGNDEDPDHLGSLGLLNQIYGRGDEGDDQE